MMMSETVNHEYTVFSSIYPWGIIYFKEVNVYINVLVYGLDIPIGSADYNLHPWYWNTLLCSLISSGDNSAFAHFAAATANHYNLAFSFLQVPITSGWTEAA